VAEEYDYSRPNQADHIGEIRRVTAIGLAVNLVLSALKLAGGLVGASQVIVADAVHSLSDSTTDVAVLIGVKYWTKPPDRLHPHGHGRIESVVTAGIGLVLMAAALSLAWHAARTLLDGHERAPGTVALAAALVSIVSKEGLYQWTVRVGRRAGSVAVVANAWHHRSDALSSIPAALAVVLTRLRPSWIFLDNLGAVIVSAFIFRVGVLCAWPAIKEILEFGASDRDLERIKEIALATPGVAEVHAIRTRYLGGNVHVDLHVLVDGAMTVREGHVVSEAVKQRLLREGPRLGDVVVHLEPCEHQNGNH
jgi:cation diffusion facilitator family transporter